MKPIETLHAKLQSLLPMKETDRQRYDQKFMLDFNYNSNHLEGNTLTYGQTELLLMFGETNGSANLKDYEEMKAHNVGLEMVKIEALDKERPLSESFIRNLNETILVRDFQKLNNDKTGTYTIHVGIYKTRPNSVITATGEKFDYAMPEETPSLMTSLIDWYREEEQKKELNPIELAALLHYRYIRIHPFEDGNGRIARLLVNYILLRHNLPMLVIRTDDKENYLQILHQCDINTGRMPNDGANATLEQIQPFVEYLKAQEIRALELAIKAAKGENIEEDDDFTKRLKLLEMQAKQKVENKNNQTQTRLDNVKGVFDYFIIPMKHKLEKMIKPLLITFYEQGWVSLYLNKNEIKITEKNNELIFDAKLQNLFIPSVNIQLSFILRYSKKEYKSLLTNIVGRNISILFDKDFYQINVLENAQFDYGTFPVEDEMNKLVNQFQTEILQQIETAIKITKI